MNELSSRSILHYLPDEFTDLKPIDLENCVFTLKDGNHIDVGAMCYRVFDRSENRTNVGFTYVKKVDLSTLDKSRYIFVGNFIDRLRLKTSLTAESKKSQTSQVMQFVSWVGVTFEHFDITDVEQVKTAYREYTKWLFHRIKLKDRDKHKIKNNYGSILQKVARTACSCMTGMSEKEIEYWAPAIRFSERDSFTDTLTANPITYDDKLKTYAALCDFIHQSWCVLIEKSQDFIKFDSQTVFVGQNIKQLNDLYRKTSIAALMSFIGASGSNLQVAIDAEIDNFEFDQTQKHVRLSGIKWRAGGKTVHPEFAAKYLSIWKKWLAIRSYWLTKIKSESNLAFPQIGVDGILTKISTSQLDKTKSMAKYYGVIWIGPRVWRGFKSKLIGVASNNDIFLSAEMQDHNVSTALRHYSNRNLADAASEISSALNAVYNSAVDRSRFKAKIEVPIVVEHHPNTSTAIGECRSEDTLKPSMAEGFTLFAPIPNCSIKETCIFCDKYAAHADSIDIRKLLSLKFLIKELGKSMQQDDWAGRWASYIFRIDEILAEIVTVDPSLIEVIESITEEVEYGSLDEFWMDYYETLTQLGVVA